MLNPETAVSFKKAIQWNFIGSCLYELIKVFHNFYLLSCMTQYTYGQTGFILSSIYLGVRIVDLGNAYSTVPLLQEMQQSKKICKKLLLRYFFLPQFPILIAGAIFVAHKINYEVSTFLVISVFILETYRLFLRYLLHAQFKNSNVVLIELCSFTLFLSYIWLPYLLYGTLKPTNILFAHFIDSMFATICLIWLTITWYRKLPDAVVDERGSKPIKIISSKIFTYFNRLGREITSSNVLTPLYASLFGYEKISIFYFLGIATTAYQMIIKNTITYSGNALLAQLRNATDQKKAYAFMLITEKLLVMLLIPLIVLCIFYQDAVKIIDSTILLLITGFLILMGIDLIMHVYEQYYLVQEAALTFFIFKMSESAACLMVFYVGPTWSIVQAFTAFIIIKVIMVSCIAMHAYARWQLTITWKKISNVCTLTVIISVITRFMLHKSMILP